jgi:hypothetical protein
LKVSPCPLPPPIPATARQGSNNMFSLELSAVWFLNYHFYLLSENP